jgi:hypothetical protein
LAYNLVEKKREDLLQELALIVCELTDEQREKIHGYFNFWCVRTMINMCGKRGAFTKKYTEKRWDVEELRFEAELVYDGDKDDMLEKVDEILKGVYWYKRDLFKLYFELGTYRAVESDVEIDHVSVYNTVNEVKKHIKENL